jgi:hypothetical protein
LITAGLSGFASPLLEGLSDAYRRVGLLRMGQWVRFFRRHDVREAILIGSVRKRDMYARFRVLRFRPDWRTVCIWYGKIRNDRRDNAVLLAVADELAKEGIPLVSSVQYCREHLATDGVMTSQSPPSGWQADIEFGWRIARQSAALDIGQALAVKEGDIIAVEAIEGTDAMIRRAGELCPSGGWTLVKVARPEQDMRFDVPTIGPNTIHGLRQAGCRCAVLEAGKTIIADKPATLALAEKLGLVLVGKTAEPTAPR